MREFKEPYYTGPDCVCCKDKNQEEKILLVVRQERRKWAAGSTVAKVLDKIIDTVIYKGRID